MRNVVLTVAGSLLLSPAVHANDFNEIFRDNGNQPADVYLHDLNRDGNLDLLAFDFQLSDGNFGTRSPMTMRPYTGNGDGTFTELETTLLQSSTNVHTLADFNADGYVDLFSDRFYAGNADGTFTQGISSGLPFCGTNLVRDLNADGLNDVICHTFQFSPRGSRFIAYINQGVFSFERHLTLPANSTFDRSVAKIAQGDLNGDGVADIVTVASILENLIGTTSSTAGHVISTNLASGNWFGEPLEWTTNELHDEENPFSTDTVSEISLGDFNNDGNSDLLLLIQGMRGTPAPSLVVYTGDGTGRFNPQKIDTRIGNLLRTASDLNVVDMNDDGNQDVVLNFLSTGNDSPNLNVAIFYGNGDGTFQSAAEIAPELRNVRNIAIGDVDGDSQLDVAAIAGWDFGNLAVFSRNQNPDVTDTPVATDTNPDTNPDTNSACLYAGSDADGDGWGWESGRSCRVTDQSRPGTGGRETNGFTHQNIFNNPPCILEDSDPDEDGWGWENGMSCIFGTGTITTFGVIEHPVCQSAATDSDGDGWGWENGASCRVSNP